MMTLFYLKIGRTLQSLQFLLDTVTREAFALKQLSKHFETPHCFSFTKTGRCPSRQMWLPAQWTCERKRIVPYPWLHKKYMRVFLWVVTWGPKLLEFTKQDCSII